MKFVESCQPFKRRLDIFGWYIPHLLGLEHTNKPPTAVTVVHQKQAVPLHHIRWALDGSCKAVEGVHEVKVYRFVRDGEG